MVLALIIDKPMSSQLYKHKLSCVEGHLVLQSPSHSPDSPTPLQQLQGTLALQTSVTQLDEQGLRCVHVHVCLSCVRPKLGRGGTVSRPTL